METKFAGIGSVQSVNEVDHLLRRLPRRPTRRGRGKNIDKPKHFPSRPTR